MTQGWTILDAAGAVLCPCFETPGEHDHPRDHGWPWVEGQQVVRIEAVPRLGSERWDGAAWVPDLDALRALAWVAIKAARDRAEAAGCTTPLGRVDTDPESQRKVNGAVTMALIAAAAKESVAIGWTMQDNTVVDHDGPATIAMGAAVGGHVAACHAVGLAKRAAVEAAEDAAAIAAVDIEGGWPDVA